MKPIHKKIKPDNILFILSLALGILFRLYKLNTIPFGTNHDGAWAALWAIELSQKPWPIQVFSNQPWLGEAMPRYIMALFIKIFGPTLFSERLGMTAFSILALPAFYFLIRLIFKNNKLAFFSTFLLAVSGWDITYAKSGWAASSVPLLSILTIYFLVKSIQTNKTIHYVFTGIFLAISFNTYRGSSLPFIIFGIFLWYLIRNFKYYRIILVQYLLFFLFFMITVSPIAWYALHHWDNYIVRPRSLYIGYKIAQTGNFSPLWDNVKKTALMYNLHGNGDDFFIKEPLLDFPTNWLFLIGLTLALYRSRQKRYLFLIFWFLTSLIPSLLGTPNGSHAIGSLPAVYIFAGLGLLFIFEMIIKIPAAQNIHLHIGITGIILLSGVLTTYTLYLGPTRRELWGFYPETTIVGNYMKPRLNNTDFYLTDNYPRDALTFLTYREGNPWIKHYTWFADGQQFLSVKKSNKNLAFIMFPTSYHKQLLQNLQQKFPSGKLSVLYYIDDHINRPAAWIFEVN